MKDLEKIKSEDLAAQVQDANPANFAIEQEVAQLVGATVPQPTEPSADDARELGAQLLVFLRRALTPIQSALRTAVAAIYAHLDSRCTAYTPAAYDPFRLPAGPYDPMRPFVPRTLPNLLTALTAFSDRKISNGSAPNDGIPDGMSLAHLLLSANTATKLQDDNSPWKCTRLLSTIAALFPNVTKYVLNCDEIEFSNNNGWSEGMSGVTEFEAPYLRKMVNHYGWYNGYGFVDLGCERISLPSFEEFACDHYGRVFVNCAAKYIDIPKFKKMTFAYGHALVYNCAELLEVNAPNLQEDVTGQWAGCINNCPKIQKLVIGNSSNIVVSGSHPDFIYLQLGQEQTKSLNISTWAPTLTEDNLATFLQNFREHIALRLTANGSGKTLTLSQAVRDAIHAAEATYGIEAIIVTQKGWRIQPDAS